MTQRAMDWTEIPYFLAVVRGGSLRLAAEQMGVSHGTVDRHINSLETSCGARLFQRTANGMRLTEAGETLVKDAEQAEAIIRGARHRAAAVDADTSGVIRLTMPSWIAYPIVAPLLTKFCEIYPGIDLDITISNRFQRISHAEADVSLRVAFDVADDVVGRRLFQWSDAVLASRTYLERHWENRGKDGDGLHWIGWAGPDPQQAWETMRPFPNAKVRHWIEDEMMFIEMLRGGHGMAVFPVVCTTLYPDLVRVPGTPVLPDRSLWLLLHPDLKNAARIRALVDFLADEFQKLKPHFVGDVTV